MKFRNIFIATVLLLTVVSCSCEKNENCSFDGPYEFELKIKLSPVKETYKIGDTITVISKLDDELFDRNTKSFYELKNFKFYPIVSIVKLDTSPIFTSVENFLIIDSVSSYFEIRYYSDGESRVLVEYDYEMNNYSLSYKIVFQDKGLYLFNQPSLLSTGGENQDFRNRCSNKSSDAVTIVDHKDNYNLVFESPDTNFVQLINNDKVDKFDNVGGYCFYVVE